MSYCVNCGVKLETSLKKCPLCNTPVINPMELTKDMVTASPYAKDKGQPETVLRKDWGLLLSIVLSATAISCGLLNAFVYKGSLWSLLIIGICILIWVFALPTIIYSKMSIYAYLLFDGFAVAAYLFMISYVTPANRWFLYMALPITTLVTIQALIFTFLYRRISQSFLSTALYIFVEIPLLCIGIELLIQNYSDKPVHLTWSAVVLTVCGVITVMLVTVLSKQRLRNAVRRRLHF